MPCTVTERTFCCEVRHFEDFEGRRGLPVGTFVTLQQRLALYEDLCGGSSRSSHLQTEPNGLSPHMAASSEMMRASPLLRHQRDPPLRSLDRESGVVRTKVIKSNRLLGLGLGLRLGLGFRVRVRVRVRV